MKAVYVEWYDAYTSDYWDDIENRAESCNKMMICKTTGWLMKKDKDKIVICHTYNKLGNDEQSTMGRLHIPKRCVIKMSEVNC